MVSLQAAWLIGCALTAGEVLTVVAMVVFWLCLWFIPGLAERPELGSLVVTLLLPIPATLVGGAAGLTWAILHPVPVPSAGNAFLLLGALSALTALALIRQNPKEMLKQAREDPLTAIFLAYPALMACGLFAAGFRLMAER